VAKSVKDPGETWGLWNYGDRITATVHSIDLALQGAQLNYDGNKSQRVGHRFVTVASYRPIRRVRAAGCGVDGCQNQLA
jgi:hypothetical protein